MVCFTFRNSFYFVYILSWGTDMNKPAKCHPHYCPFDSPACPEQCTSACKRIKPNCVSITAQEALNIPELKVPRSKAGIPAMGICTRERIFGIPYDPRKDVDIQIPQEDLDLYLRENYDTLHDRALKEYLRENCCETECKCPMGPCCICRTSSTPCKKQHENKM